MEREALNGHEALRHDRAQSEEAPRLPEAAAYGRWYLDGTLAVLDAEIGPRPFVAGDRCTIADCTLFAALDFAEIFQIPFGISTPNVMRWYESFKRRPSAAA